MHNLMHCCHKILLQIHICCCVQQSQVKTYHSIHRTTKSGLVLFKSHLNILPITIRRYSARSGISKVSFSAILSSNQDNQITFNSCCNKSLIRSQTSAGSITVGVRSDLQKTWISHDLQRILVVSNG